MGAPSRSSSVPIPPSRMIGLVLWIKVSSFMSYSCVPDLIHANDLYQELSEVGRNLTSSVIDMLCKLNDRISHNLDPRNQIVPVSILFECMTDTADRGHKQHAGWHVVGEVHGVVQCT